jgi:hypothetical protein
MSTVVLRNGFKMLSFSKPLTKRIFINAFILNYENNSLSTFISQQVNRKYHQKKNNRRQTFNISKNLEARLTINH